MAIRELETFPQVTYSEGQGQVGTRRWVLDWNDDLDAFMNIVCSSHWPGRPDCIPIQVQSGPYWEGVIVKRDCDNPRSHETLGDLPKYNKMAVVAQYALHQMTNCWPARIPKPWHPAGTTLNLRIKGSGQMLLLSPAGLRSGSRVPVEYDEGGNEEALAGNFAIRICLPITEYHISCDRMTVVQAEAAMRPIDWDDYQGAVNKAEFLGAKPGTLLFDGYEVSETRACDSWATNRYCLTACLKQRIITTEHDGKPKKDGKGNYIGWNHDYVNLDGKVWGWHVIKLMDEKNNRQLRYSPLDFTAMFGGSGKQKCGQTKDCTTTPLGDCDLVGDEESV